MVFECKVQFLYDANPFITTKLPEPINPPSYVFRENTPLATQLPHIHRLLKAPHHIDEAALQLSHNLNYLDLEVSIEEQEELLGGLKDDPNNTIILRTQISVRVHNIISELLNASDVKLCKSLISLKQIFQDDIDLVHEFVTNDGLSCLVTVGCDGDQNQQHHILRVIGEIMLYVDGMNGVINHSDTLQWLYSLLSSTSCSLQTTTFNLLVVFVEYAEESNSLLVWQAIQAVDKENEELPMKGIIDIISKSEGKTDVDLLLNAMIFVNKLLYGITDQDLFYDIVDALEVWGMQSINVELTKLHSGNDKLIEQCNMYDFSIKLEDGNMYESPIPDGAKSQRKIDPGNESHNDGGRKDRRHCSLPVLAKAHGLKFNQENDKMTKTVGITSKGTGMPPNEKASLGKTRNGVERRTNGGEGRCMSLRKMFSNEYKKANVSSSVADKTSSNSAITQESTITASTKTPSNSSITHESTITASTKTPKLKANVSASQAMLKKQNAETGKDAETGKEKVEKKGNFEGPVIGPTMIKPHIAVGNKPTESKTKYAEQDVNVLRNSLLVSNEYEFKDLNDEDDYDTIDPPRKAPKTPVVYAKGSPPPPPTPPGVGMPPPPPPPAPTGFGTPPPPPPPAAPSAEGVPPPPPGIPQPGKSTQKVSKPKCVHLFWAEATPVQGIDKSIWGSIKEVNVDVKKIEELFGNKVKAAKKHVETLPKKEIAILDITRAQSINILLKRLPPINVIKKSILDMDSAVIDKESLEKIIHIVERTTDDEIQRLQGAQIHNPDIPIGHAESFLLTLSSISELSARLNLWNFQLGFDNTEKEIKQALYELKNSCNEIRKSETFKRILALLLTIGNILNGVNIKAFKLTYLQNVHDVKDTVRKQTLLYHLCSMTMEMHPHTSDLYSELEAVHRSSDCNYESTQNLVKQLDRACNDSWENLRLIAKQDSSSPLKQRLTEFLGNASERIAMLKIIHRRVVNRFTKLIQYLGMSYREAKEVKPHEFCKIISEFSLGYRTIHQSVLQTRNRNENMKMRAKTRGKLITGEEVNASNKMAQESNVSATPGSADDETINMLLKNTRKGKKNKQVRQSRAKFPKSHRMSLRGIRMIEARTGFADK